MKVLNFGSLNIDYVYSVDDFVRPGETKHAKKMDVFCGGKGLNQSVALARAGLDVYHAGLIGHDGEFLMKYLESADVKVNLVEMVDSSNGHAIIQVNSTGQNNILLHGGSNQMITESYVDRVLNMLDTGDIVLMQNEVNHIEYMINEAKKRGLQVAFNAAPIDDQVKDYPLDKVDYLFINEIEGELLSGHKEYDSILKVLSERFPDCCIVLTLGENGVIYQSGSEKKSADALRVDVVDTTAAGDTFIGYFIRGLIMREDIEETLLTATKASALCVQREGASVSIPALSEVLE